MSHIFKIPPLSLGRKSHAKAEESHLLPDTDAILHHVCNAATLCKPGCECVLEIGWALLPAVSTKTHQVEVSLKTIQQLPLQQNLLLPAGRVHPGLQINHTGS